MKSKIITSLGCMLLLFVAITANAQTDKSKRASPPEKVSETIKSGATVSIDYSKPSVKGRTIGKEIATYGKVWRTGANEATVFEVDKAVKINGKDLPAGKYGLYSIPGEDKWIIIFNKTWNQWGTKYAEADDVLRIEVKPVHQHSATEQMTFKIEKSGEVNLLWGNVQVPFKVK